MARGGSPSWDSTKPGLTSGSPTTRGLLGYVDVSYANACTFDVAGTLRAARTACKATGEREEHKRKRYPPEQCLHVEFTPFVVEARGRLGAEVVPFRTPTVYT